MIEKISQLDPAAQCVALICLTVALIVVVWGIVQVLKNLG